MSNSTNDMSEKLLRYLDDELSGSDKDEVENRLAGDESLRRELENLKLAREAVRSYGLQQKVTGIHEQMMEELRQPVKNIGQRKRFIRYSIAIAASVLVVLVATWIYSSNTLSSEKLFAENYHAYELTTLRGGNTEETAIEKAYRAKDYKTVTSFGDTLTDPKDLFLSGVSYLEMKNSSAAIRQFQKVINKDAGNGSVDFRDESEYYMALAMILDMQYGKAEELLKQIKNNPEHLYHEKVTDDLLQDLKKLM